MILHAAIGRYPHTEPLFHDPALVIDAFPVISRAFAPMVREQTFDLCEMAIATFLMARAAGSDLVLLPIVLAARAQTGALLRRADDRFGPADLAGRRIGVRAYSQTTGLWLRGMLQDDHDLKPQDSRWITFEDAHVASFRDPPWAERAEPGSDMLAMLRNGHLDAAIFGNDVPSAPDLDTVYPVSAGPAFAQKHGFDPVNHMLVLRADIASQPGQARALLDKCRPGNHHPFGRSALDPAVTLAARYAAAQNLTPGELTLDQIWAGLPPDCQR